MRKLFYFILFFGITINVLGQQSCISAYIHHSWASDTTENNSGDTVQLSCSQDYIQLKAFTYAPGASTNYIYESIPFNPPCSFNLSEYDNRIDVDISASDDVWGNVFSLSYGLPTGAPPFVFSFYGNTYNSCIMSTNGNLSFNLAKAGQGCSWSTHMVLPSTASTEFLNCIFSPYHDIHFGQGGSMSYIIVGDYPCRRLILSYYQVPMYICTNLLATQMIVLYETTNTIEFYMLNKPSCPSWNSGWATLGIQNADGTQGLAITNSEGVSYNGTSDWTAQNEAWRIRPQGNLSQSTQWYRRSATSEDYNRVGLNLPTEGPNVTSGSDEWVRVQPTQEEGPMWYIMETTIDRLPDLNGNVDVLYYSDSILVKPIDLPPFYITHNGDTGRYDTVCLGNNIAFSLNGAHQYKVKKQAGMTGPVLENFTTIANPNNYVDTPTQDIYYIFEADNQNEMGQWVCTRRDTVIVHPREFSVRLFEDTSCCNGDEMSFLNLDETSPTGTSSWFFNNDVIPNQSATTLSYVPPISGNLKYKLTDALNCFAEDVVYIQVNEAPQVSINGDTNICLGTTTLLTANSSKDNCTFEWDNGQKSPSISVKPEQSETQYEVSVTYGPTRCETKASVIVRASDKPIINVNNDISICYGDSTTIALNGNVDKYYWHSIPMDEAIENSTEESLKVHPKISTMYIAFAEDSIGCINSDTTIVYVNPLPEVQMDFNPKIIDDLDPLVIFEDKTENSFNRLWTISDGAQSNESYFVHTFTLSDTIRQYIVKLMVETDKGCTDSTDNIIRIHNTHYCWAPTGVYIYDNNPSVSTFRVYVDNPIDFLLKIYNRWGEVVFSTTNQENVWDCKYKGEYVQTGAYVWKATYRYADKKNDVVTQSGEVFIYR
ncbi:MAG: gliding motility-associated C-terminal domain-containing protein [Bacteroidales bacterium]|jgi:hypothetical protein|nr:gliding motility-associated C-terminal domain-containing protein [Bacteroidales bacterium]